MPQHHTIRNAHHTKRQQPLVVLASVLALAAAGPAMAADNPGAHEHGHAVLQMAVEDNRIDLMLTSPAHNLAGFEHEPRNDEQRDRLADINQWLETTALVDTATPGCHVTAASVQLGEEMGGDHDEHHGKHHGEHHKEHHKEHHGDKGHHDHHDEDHHDRHKQHHGHGDKHKQATHREYEVSQQLACEGIGASQEFTSALMERFAELEELTVEWVSPSGQGSARLTSSNRAFTVNN